MASELVPSVRARRRALRAGTALSGALLGLLLARQGQAAPQGSQIVAGQAQIRQVSPQEIDIIQKSQRLVLDWANFNIASGETVRFIQGANEVALNEIAGGPSLINGNLFADARLILVNAAGLAFGRQANVRVGALVATTANIAVPDFLSGRYAFTQAGQSTAPITNQGSITAAQGGLVALVAPSVVNSGVISARFGKVALASGNSFFLDLYGDHLVNLVVGDQVVGGQVSNSGSIIADGGRVQLSAAAVSGVVSSAINMSGVIQARAVTGQGGVILLEGGAGSVEVAGTLDASGGGTVKVLGKSVALDATALVDVSGASGGGTALIGGNFHGAGPEQNAQTTTISAGAVIDADATGLGNGGRVAVWSDGMTTAAGTITARGGALGGNGGFIETSGQGGLLLGTAAPDAGARHGAAGTWLLDPQVVVIVAGMGEGSTPNSSTTTLGAGLVMEGLQKNDVVIDTTPSPTASSSITVNSALIYGSAHSLLLMTEGAIAVNASIQNTQATGGGIVALVAGWDGKTGGPFPGPLVSMGVSVGSVLHSIATTPGAFGTLGGSVVIGQATGTLGVAVGSLSGLTSVLAHDLTLQGGTGSFTPAHTVTVTSSTGSGSTSTQTTSIGTAVGALAQLGFDAAVVGLTGAVSATGAISAVLTGGGVTLAGGTGLGAFAQIGHGGFLTDTNANAAITVSAGGGVLLQGGSGADAYAQIGHGGASLVIGKGVAAESLAGAITVSAGGGVTLLGGTGRDPNSTNTSGSGNAYAQIGHGGADSTFGATGGITVSTLGGVLLQGGFGADGYAQIGHGGANAVSAAGLGGAILVRAGSAGVTLLGGSGSLTTSSGSSGGAYAQIGMGGDTEKFSTNAAITVSTAGAVLLQGGNLIDAYAQIGQGGANVDAGEGTGASLGGAILVEAGSGGVTLLGGSTNPSTTGSTSGVYAQIGQGGFDFALNGHGGGISLSGAVTVSTAGSVVLSGGSASGAYAQIGHGGSSAVQSAFAGGVFNLDFVGAVMVKAGGDVMLGGGGGQDAYAQIGHGGAQIAEDNHSQDMFAGGVVLNAAFTGGVMVQAGGNLTLGGGGGQDAYAQIGLGGAQLAENNINININNNNTRNLDLLNAAFTGGVAVKAGGNVTLGGGGGQDAYAQIGLGGAQLADNVDGNRVLLSSSIGVSAGGSVMLAGGSALDAYAQIGVGGASIATQANRFLTTLDLIGTVAVSAGGNVVLLGGTSASTATFTAGSTLTTTVPTSGMTTTGTTTANTQIFTDGGGAYVQIGNGGFDLGQGVVGAVSVTGGVVVQAGGAVQLLGAQQAPMTATMTMTTSSSMSAGSGTSVITNSTFNTTATLLFGNNDYMQIGNGGDEAQISTSTAVATASQAVQGTVQLSGNVTVTAQAVTLAAGLGDNAYAQLGGGGYGWGSGSGFFAGVVGLRGEVAVTTRASAGSSGGGVTLQGGGSGAYAQIGEGGLNIAQGSVADVSLIGGVTVTAAGGVTLLGGTGGTSGGAYAQIGFGGSDLTTAGPSQGVIGSLTVSADVSAVAPSFLLQGGGFNSDALIGDGGFGWLSSSTGSVVPQPVLVPVLTAGSSTISFRQIVPPPIAFFGNVTVRATQGDVVLVGGSGAGGYAQIGNGGADFGAKGTGGMNLGGAVMVSAAGAVSLAGGSASGAYAQLGDGGDQTTTPGNASLGVSGGVVLTGNVAVTAQSVTLAGGAGTGAYAQIGLGGGAFAGGTADAVSLDGAVTVSSRGDVVLTGGSGGYAQIGVGGGFAAHSAGAVSVVGTVTVSAGGVVTLDGSGGSYAQIGNGGSGFGASADGVVSLGGQVAVSAVNDVVLTGGTGVNAYAQIGNGAANGTADGTVGGIIDLRSGGTLTTGSSAFIGDKAAALSAGNAVLILAGSFSDSGTAGIGAVLAASLASDLAGGSVTVAAKGDVTLDAPVTYSGTNALNLVAGGNLVLDAAIGDSKAGAVNLVAGWDGVTGLSKNLGGGFGITALESTAGFGKVFAANGKAVELASTIVTTGGAVTSTGLVQAAASAATIDTSGGTNAAKLMGAITLGELEGATPGQDGLVLAAGGGSVVLQRGSDATMQLGPFTVLSAGAVMLGGTGLNASSLTVTAGSVTGSIVVANTVVLSVDAANLTGTIAGTSGTPAAGKIALTKRGAGPFVMNGAVIP